MSTFVNDEIEDLKKAKLEKFMKDAKKHKSSSSGNNNINIQHNGKKQQVEPQKAMPSPPMLLINAIITQAVTLSFDKDTDDDILVAQSFTINQLLDNALKLVLQVYPNLTEEQIEQASENLKKMYKNIRYYGYIGQRNGNELFATKIALIYSNTLSFLPINDPFTQYAHYLELARNG